MKKIQRLLPLLCTVLIICLGLYMPRLSSAALDYSLRTQVKQMENNNISLTLSKEIDFFERAALFNSLIRSGYSEVELSENSQLCSMETSAVKITAMEAIADIQAADTIKDEPTAVPFLLVGTDDDSVTQSGVYWQCIWYSLDGGINILWLDDLSGKMVGLMLDCTNLYKYPETAEETSHQADGYVNISEDTIPSAVILLGNHCRADYQADHIEFYNLGDDNYIITLTRDEDEQECSLLVRLQSQGSELLFFNV